MNDLRRLREENDELRERIRQLEDLMAPRVIPPVHLSKLHYKLYCALMKTPGVVVRSEVLYSFLGNGVDEVDDPKNNLSVHILRLRRSLAPLGYAIVCDRGHGYTIHPPVSPP